MPKKTWFQHDINCHQKEKLSLLISRGGFEAYGRFWAFVEMWYSMQLHKEGYSETMMINESVLMNQLQMNRRSLPKLLRLFDETLGILFQNNGETYPIVYRTTWVKSLNFINKRFQKTGHIDIDTEIKEEERERERVRLPKPRSQSSKPRILEHPNFPEFWREYPNKEDKKDALKVFNEIDPDMILFDQIMVGLRWQKESERWTKDNGQFIPGPGKWLRRELWTNKKPEATNDSIIFP